jgi:hypothetical protein
MMSPTSLDEFMKDNHDAILAGVAARMRGDDQMQAVAGQRQLSEGDLSSQVLGFWLQGIRSDLTLGSTTAMEQNMKWLVSFRAGHELPFDGKAVRRCLAEISAEIDSRLDSQELRGEYAAYRGQVEKLVADSFPDSSPDSPQD